jgi:hypothetical protein
MSSARPLGMRARSFSGWRGARGGVELRESAARDLRKALSPFFEHSLRAGRLFVARDGDVDVERIELDPAARSPRLLGRDQGSARAQERVKNDLAAVGKVQQSVGQHSGRLHGGMGFQALSRFGPEARRARRGPDI